MIVVVYDPTTGEARSIGSQVPPTLPSDLSLYTLDVEYSALNGFEWDATNRTLAARAPAVQYTMTVAQFKRRVGIERLTLLNMLEMSDQTPLMVRAQLKTLREFLSDVQASGVDVRDEVTQAGAGAIANVLLSQNALPEGATAFVAALLAPVAVTP